MWTYFEILNTGGWVMYPLIFIAFVLWWLLLLRYQMYNTERTSFLARPEKSKVLCQSLLTIAPLLGLLGTVNGMIETFSSLGTMSLHTQSGGIAGGISQALISTQMGLVVTIPALLFYRYTLRLEEAQSENQKA